MPGGLRARVRSVPFFGHVKVEADDLRVRKSSSTTKKMPGKKILRIANTITLAACLISPLPVTRSRECEGQRRTEPLEYDYYSLAIASILNSAAEASKLPNVPQRVKLLIDAAKSLPLSERAQSLRLLEVALRDLRDWGSENTATGSQKHRAEALRNEVLAVYAGLDPERAATLQKEYAAETEGSTSEAIALNRNDWFRQFSRRRIIADQAAKMALTLVDTQPEKALGLVVQSLQTGILSEAVADISQKLMQSGNRALLNRLEIAAPQILLENLALDPFTLTYAAALLQSDRDMPASARVAFVAFFMRSLQTLCNQLKDPGTDVSYVRLIFTMFSLNVRPVILQYSSEQLLAFDIALDQVAPFVPEQARATLEAFKPEQFSEPRDRLDEIRKDPNPQRRDLRLVRLISELLLKDKPDVQEFDLAADAVDVFSDPDNKSTFSALLTIARVNGLVKQKKFLEAQHRARSISSEETRVWALLALSKAAAKVDAVLAFELVTNALKALDTSSPSPYKVELALLATAMLAKGDSQRAFDTFSAASRYANSSAARVDPPTKPAVAFGLEATIGDARMTLGVFTHALDELQLDPALSSLGITDWFRADQIVNDIREPSLRLQLKLQLARAVIAEGKPTSKESPKRAAKH
jgi:hypothetical protein